MYHLIYIYILCQREFCRSKNCCTSIRSRQTFIFAFSTHSLLMRLSNEKHINIVDHAHTILNSRIKGATITYTIRFFHSPPSALIILVRASPFTGGCRGAPPRAPLDNNLYRNVLHLFAFYVAVLEVDKEDDLLVNKVTQNCSSVFNITIRYLVLIMVEGPYHRVSLYGPYTIVDFTAPSLLTKMSAGGFERKREKKKIRSRPLSI
jgi:hypothetical protein